MHFKHSWLERRCPLCFIWVSWTNIKQNDGWVECEGTKTCNDGFIPCQQVRSSRICADTFEDLKSACHFKFSRVYMFVCMLICSFIYICMFIYVYLHRWIRSCMSPFFIYICICIRNHWFVCIYHSGKTLHILQQKHDLHSIRFLKKGTYLCVYIHIHTYLLIFTYIHICTFRQPNWDHK